MENFTPEAYAAFQESATEKYDFSTCQRPDGSYYGTGGTCRKGSPVSGGVPKKEKKGGGGGGTESSQAMSKVKIMTKGDVKKASNATLEAQVSNANKAGLGKGSNASQAQMKGLKEQHDMAKAELAKRKKGSGGMTLRDAQKRGMTTGGSKNPNWRKANNETASRKTLKKTSDKDRAKD